MVLPITTTMAGAATILNLWLAVRAAQVRVQGKIMIGDGGNPKMLARSRAHGNFTEYTPFFLILLFLIEYARGPESWLWGISVLFILARIAHPLGLERPAPNRLRAGGILVTWLILLILAGYALYLPYAMPR
ncbi:MAPEG family protein [Sphingomonas sp. BIUV-7]|uniref:MAPEG family protein n=1 Tax=Sphingomonas natans TaxID=3063330 RepID=A0ABT8YDZ8_9SPHN|nr:MAPEG family protein [Sphingomonas sp. BIUV-7]MDO6415874.1 MAPEG family protein [Sphingomonas sp. BIUV-7]